MNIRFTQLGKAEKPECPFTIKIQHPQVIGLKPVVDDRDEVSTIVLDSS